MDTIEKDDVWEVSLICREQCPDDWQQWPEKEKGLSQIAVDRFLKQNPDASVIHETSMCMAPGHPRYPQDAHLPDHLKGAFYLVRAIVLDRPIPVT
jgi:hypothetical protein